MDELFSFNPEAFLESFSGWVKQLLESSGAVGTVSGLSGGIDSAVVAVLLSRVLDGNHRCLFVDVESSEVDYEDAKLVADSFGIPLERVDLNQAYNEILRVLPEGKRIARANLKPRLRMMVFYYYANNENRLVAGTGNKSELKVGYFTKYGDGAVDFLPIGDLYKTQVRMLARFLGIPERIIVKPPSAGLWKGQTDEGELGISYEELDRALLLIENGREAEVDEEILRKVKGLISRSEHKLKLPPVFSFGV
jgi:NAD+ synthase